MEKMIAIVMALLFVLTSACMAEGVPFSEWIAGRDPVAVDVPVEEATAEEAPVAETPAFEPIGIGSRGETVAQVQTKLIELGILNSRADGIFGPASEAAVKYTQKALGREETGIVESLDELNIILSIKNGDGINHAVQTSSEWSEWFTPEYNAENVGFTASYAYLGEKEEGDFITSQIEIEFANVTETSSLDEEHHFNFNAQGQVDGEWVNWNIWNNSLIHLTEAPANGVYRFIATQRISEENKNATKFRLGFRCDNWGDGSFRYRCVKVEKGIAATDWSIAPGDVGDGINLAVESSSEWTDWMAPEYGEENQGIIITNAVLGAKEIGDSYTCQIEIEYSGVTAIDDAGERSFNFNSQGTVDSEWTGSSIWNNTLVHLTQAPSDGVYKYISTNQITKDNKESSVFRLSFRCDNWASGAFRIRCVKVERGATATEWSPSSQSMIEVFN